MTRSVIETILGAVVILIAAYFLVFSYRAGHSGPSGGGYEIYADFAGIGGLKVGDDVSLSGVKVGSVSSVELVPDSYLARVKMSVKDGIKLPVDTAALISSQSLLGGRYLAIEPGAEEETIKPGGKIQYTQAPQNLEQLLGQFIFSMQSEKKGEDKGETPTTDEAQPAPAPAPAPEMPSAQAPAT